MLTHCGRRVAPLARKDRGGERGIEPCVAAPSARKNFRDSISQGAFKEATVTRTFGGLGVLRQWACDELRASGDIHLVAVPRIDEHWIHVDFVGRLDDVSGRRKTIREIEENKK